MILLKSCFTFSHFHASRITHHASRITFHVSHFRVSRFNLPG
ncbi:hypothetical protein QUF80_14565 [Desulfococcaceae bacterium HSG8]|nr:hypothetical protein [Desulfococcaceae bacterium HSG8]